MGVDVFLQGEIDIFVCSGQGWSGNNGAQVNKPIEIKVDYGEVLPIKTQF